jgi:hypothetical protein
MPVRVVKVDKGGPWDPEYRSKPSGNHEERSCGATIPNLDCHWCGSANSAKFVQRFPKQNPPVQSMAPTLSGCSK